MQIEERIDDALLASLFRLGQGLFGIPAAQIQEVVQVGSLTPVHHAPPWVIGIRNLRGRIVTVIDLVMRLELGEADAGPQSRILIVDTEGELVGLLVDKVEDTVFLDTALMSGVSNNPTFLKEAAVCGVYQCSSGLASLLDHRSILLPANATPRHS